MPAFVTELSDWVFPGVIAGVVTLGLLRRIPIYEAFIDGAKEGFTTTLDILPHLIGMLIAVQMVQASGLMAWLIDISAPFFQMLAVPADVVPLALLRPLSGAASSAVMLSIFAAHGPDSWLGRLASIMQGSTDTTLYILAVYFGAVGIRRYRYALWVGLFADAAGLTAAFIVHRLFFGPPA
ncbi:MAG: spore maturation protein [Hydrogenibacillus sp.]|nr:spore maturation protein [Hydrogenibacillus sp.]